MKFRCERDLLAESLATAGRAAAGRAGPRPALSGVRVDVHGDEATLTGTDLELTIQVRFPVQGQADGSAVLPTPLAGDVVRSLEPGAVSLQATADEVEIGAGRSQFTIKPFSVDDYPKVATPPTEGVTLSAAVFRDALRQVVRAASHDESRQILTGVLFSAEEGGLRLVATDSYRLAVRDLAGPSILATGQSVVVPARALNELVRVLPASGDVVVRLGTADATFSVGSIQLGTKLIEGEFPSYRQLIPSVCPNQLRVPRDHLLDALRRVKVMARDTTPVRLHMAADELRLEAIHQEQGKADDSLDATYQGDEITVAFNAEYLESGVDGVVGDEVILQTVDALKPAVLKAAEHDDFLYLLMPVRVS